MPHKFIHKGISFRVITMKNHISKQERFDASFVENNDKNDLYHVIDSVRNNDLGILTDCIYTDVNESR